MKAVVLGALAILAATTGFAARKLFAKKPAVSGKIFSAAPKTKESNSVVPRREDIAQIDILKILKFQSEILFEECTNTTARSILASHRSYRVSTAARC